jgi:hypothetical protein
MRAAMRQPSSLISWAHCAPLGAFVASLQSCGSIHVGNRIRRLDPETAGAQLKLGIMCNLYSETKGQAAIRALFRTAYDRTGNLPTFPGIFPS